MKVGGTVHVPGDKSISHRALLVGALGTGESRVRGILESADIQSTAGVLRALGVRVPDVASEMRLRGVGLRGLRAPDGSLDCGNSGTTTRLVAGLLAASRFEARFIGDESLSRRPMRRVAQPLEAMGARVTFEGPADGLPMTVKGGAIRPIAWKSGTASAQVKSAILLAALAGEVTATVTEPVRSRDHTERLLSSLGVRLERSSGAEGERVTIYPATTLPALDLRVPGDPSSAAFFAALAALASSGSIALPDVLLNETRAGFFATLREMGTAIDEEPGQAMGAGEPTGTLRVHAARLRGIALPPGRIPSMIDELPLLACVASRAEGETVVTGAAELRVKESDRIATVVGNLREIGAEAEELSDGFRIVGTATPLRGLVRTQGDHRIAMAFGILSALDGVDIEIDDPGCVAVSYPGFWSDLQRVVA